MTAEKPSRKRRGKFAMSAAEGRKLTKMFDDLMAEVGARTTPSGYYDFELDTPLGLLGIRRIDVEYCHVFACFDNPSLASYYIGCGDFASYYAGCNDYSGKWNFHFNRDYSPEDVIQLLSHRFRLVLDAKPEYRGCSITPESSCRPIYFGVGLVGTDLDGCSRHFVRVIFPDQTWIRCANPVEAKRYIDSPYGIAQHAAT